MSCVTVEDLYKAFTVISETKGSEKDQEDSFLTLIRGVKGNANEQRLASQFIARFFKLFPKHHDIALNAMIDLLEDDNVLIRRQAIKDLPAICKNTSLTQKIADVLVQMLQTEDSDELSAVQQSLTNLLALDFMETLRGIFNQILVVDVVEIIRERAVHFLSVQLKELPEVRMTAKIEEFLVEQCEQVLEKDVSEEEFLLFINILSNLKSMKTVTGRQRLVKLILDQSDLKNAFDPTDSSSIARVRECIKQAIPMLSKNVHAGDYVGFFMEKVLPQISIIPEELDLGTGGGKETPRLDLLKVFAELSAHTGPAMEVSDEQLTALFNLLISLMPLPISENIGFSSAVCKELKFSEVECLLYSFHQLCRRRPEFLIGNAERLTDFRSRLQYFSRETQVYLKSLKDTLKSKTKEDLKEPENKLRVIALKLTNNVNVLIRELFKNPPSFKAIVTLSWRPSVDVLSVKRSSDASIDSKIAIKTSKREDATPYRPPTGKFSNRVGYMAGNGASSSNEWRRNYHGRAAAAGKWRYQYQQN